MSYPKNKYEWWALVDENWEKLMSIMNRFLSLNNLATDPPGKLTGKIMTHTALLDIIRAKENRDGHKLLRYFNGAWGEAPDKSWIHEIPAWGVLCDLCSEDYVLDEKNV